jgi:hypothetical protein
MSQALHIPDETYAALQRIAQDRGLSVEALLQSWVDELTQPPTQPGAAAQYDPARDPLAEYLGAFEAISSDDVERHDEFFGAPDANTGK